MKKFVGLFLIVGIMLSMVTMPTVMADGLTVSSWNADTTSITIDFSGACTVTDATTRNSYISITQGANTITFTSTLMSSSKTLLIKPTGGLLINSVYSVTLNTGLGLTAAYTKQFILNQLFADDFSTNDISTNWKNVGAAVYDSTTGAMKIDSTSASAVNGLGPNNSSATTWTDYTWESDFTFNDSPISGMDYRLFGRSEGGGYATGPKYVFMTGYNGIYQIRKINSSNVSTTLSVSSLANVSMVANTTYHYKFVFKGSSIKTFINDTLQYDFTDTTISAGTIGVRSGTTAHMLIDNVAVTKAVEFVPRSVSSWNADTSSIAFDFSDTIPVSDATTRNSYISITQGSNTITDFTSTLINGDKTLVINPTGGITKDLPYSVTLNTGLGIGETFIKEFKLQELFADDFSTNDISTNWKNVGAAVYDSTTNKMKIVSTVTNAVSNLQPNVDSAITWTDYTFECALAFADVTAANCDYGINVRSDGQYYTVGNTYQFRLNNMGIYEIRKIISGTSTTLSVTRLATPYQLTANQEYHFKFVVKGNDMRVFMDNVFLYDITDTAITAGTFSLRAGTASNTLLVDNVAVTKAVDLLNVQSCSMVDNALNVAINEPITVNFSTPITVNALKTALDVREQGATSAISNDVQVELSNNDTTATITFTGDLEYNKTYVLTVPEIFAAANGATLGTDFTRTFTTKKAAGVNIVDSLNVNINGATSLATATAITCKVIVDNPTTSIAGAWIVVAAYGTDNELLAINCLSVSDVSAGGNSGEKTFDLTVKGGTQLIKAFAWDSSTSLVPYHIPEVYPE